MIIPKKHGIYKGINYLAAKGNVLHVSAPEFFQPVNHKIPFDMSKGRLFPTDCIFQPGTIGLQVNKQSLSCLMSAGKLFSKSAVWNVTGSGLNVEDRVRNKGT